MRRLHVALVLFAALLVASSSAAEQLQIIRGAGPSTSVVQLFVDRFSKLAQAEGYTLRVKPQSDKHAGGISASDKYIFGRTGRPLNDAEKALNKDEIFLARVPISFAVGSKVGISSLSMRQVQSIFTGAIVN